MKRVIIGELEARELLQPYYEVLVNIHSKSFEILRGCQDHLATKFDRFYSSFSLTKSIMTWDLTVNIAEDMFKHYQEISHVVHSHNSHWFNFHGLLISSVLR
jgi:hypothetical protein